MKFNMSDLEDENYVTFGVSLDPLDEENFPRKKPVTIEEQYAYDAQGRRRFHGAFTGGFSAGYFNTVGTRDGWRPQQFKSSRSSKAENITQRPEDFMDEEDTSEFGIAPTGIRATSDYTDHGQRGTKRDRVNQDNNGPIPGTPVLKELLKPVKETVGIMLLKKMGWKPGQGVGSRVTKKEKAKIKRRNERIRATQQRLETVTPGTSSEESDDENSEVTFAPDDYEPFRCNPKDNYFGIGYSGLERRSILSGHINLFDVPAFSVQDKNKKLSIHGQAFGVGAFEADDEDIYQREDMSRYDFALGPERKTKSRWSDDSSSRSLRNNCLEGFLPARNKFERKKLFPPPELPKSFLPVHVVRKSRFYPPIESIPCTLENGKRKDLTAVDRARILDDSPNYSKLLTAQPNAVPSVASNIVSRTLNLHGKQQSEERQRLENEQSKSGSSWMDKLNVQSFVKGGIVGSVGGSEGSLKKLEEFKDSTAASNKTEKSVDAELEESNSHKPCTMKPFLSDPDKQRRYEQYLDLLKKGEKNKLETIQPLSMTEWDREHERTEFEQAVRLFEQSIDYMGTRFTHAAATSSDAAPNKCTQEDEVKQAAKMKLFGKLTRERIEWKPASLVCKRFNIPEPKVGCVQIEVQRTSARFSIFDSLNWNNPARFLKATDTVPNEENKIGTLPKETTIMNHSSLRSKSHTDTSLDDHQALEPVSEKIRNFEASYEKIFGKEVQGAAGESIEEKQNLQSVDEKVNTLAESQFTEVSPTNEESASTSTATSKSTSEEKKDLFKAIFLSSSEESDLEPEESVDSEALKSVLIGKVPSEVNVDRNTSPPRGIFAKVDLDDLVMNPANKEWTNNKVSEAGEQKLVTDSELGCNMNKNQNISNTNIKEVTILPDMYGPALPARLMKTENSSLAEPSSSQTFKPVFKSVIVPKVSSDSKICGKWVERSKVKKSKKEKKKHKHKEHKSSKHKRKSKKEWRDS